MKHIKHKELTRTPANNSVYVAIAGEVLISSFVHLMKFSAEKPRLRIAATSNSSLNELLPNPNVILQKNNETLETYKIFLYDAHVSNCVQSRKAGVLSLNWEINRGGTKALNRNLSKKF